jgi:hypothetical protein
VNILKLILIPYFGLGGFTAVAFSSRSAWHPGVTGIAVLAAFHVLLLGFSFLLTAKSKQNGITLSPGALSIGFALAYVAGLLMVLFV